MSRYDSFKEGFLRLVSGVSVHIEKKILKNKTEDTNNEVILFFFNQCVNLQKYVQELESWYVSTTQHALIHLDTLPNKVQQILFAKNEKIHFESLCNRIQINEESGYYNHQIKSFYDYTGRKALDWDIKLLDNYQFHIIEMQLYLKKIIQLFSSIIDYLEATNYNDTTKVQLTKESEYASTLKNPIRFLENSLTINGLKKHLADFFPAQDEEYASNIPPEYMDQYDKDNEIKIVVLSPPGDEPITKTVYFKDYFRSIINKEVQKSIDIIDDFITNSGKKEEIYLYLEIILNKLTYLNSQVRTKRFEKYELGDWIILPFIRFLSLKYKSFVAGNILEKEVLRSSNDKVVELPEPEPEEKSDTIRKVNDVEFKPFKTNLSVPQLAYLFYLFKVNGNFEPFLIGDFYNFIRANFSSKKSEFPSFHSIKNFYEIYSGDDQKVDTNINKKIIKILKELLQKAKNDK